MPFFEQHNEAGRFDRRGTAHYLKTQNEDGCMPAWLTVVGIGDDGFAGLGRAARRALLEASVVYGGERHLAMLPARLAARRAAC